MKHGTTTAYTTHKCRCGVCVAGMREYQRRRRARLGAKPWPRERVVSGAAADPEFWVKVWETARVERGF